MSQFLPQLPVCEALPALEQALGAHHVVVLSAPPGAGKSTLVPLALQSQAFMGAGKIVMLEPRRMAARALAQRMAQLLGEPVGERVGYRTRLETRVSRHTCIEVITEGILTRMLQEDASLEGIACVIFDEFHERSLHADLGLALTLESRQTLRPDLRILVMSATLDTSAVAALLGDAAVITAAGRSFEVKTHYAPARAGLSLELHMARITRAALHDHAGDVLCFLPGGPEIRRLQRNLESMDLGGRVRVLPLYADLSPAAQDAALARAAEGERKIVLATSIAETSLTIEGVRIIVDSGLRRYSRFDPLTGMSRLETGKVSQAAAEQRRGRAGRLDTGVCYRLWSQGAQDALAAQTAPQIMQADLAPLALELACWGAHDAHSLRWMDPPPPAALAQARELLHRLEALDAGGRITAHGRELARIGAHPRLAHMLVRSRALGKAALACDLAAILGERDILRSAPGVRDADIRLRVDLMHGGRQQVPAGMSVDERALAQARRVSAQWKRQFREERTQDFDADRFSGVALAFAYPDRIGQRRGDGGRYLLANGRGAILTDAQSLSRAEYIVAAEVDGAEREARIHLAAPLSAALLEQHFGSSFETHESIHWDPQQQAVRAVRERRLGTLVLESAALEDPDHGAITAAVLEGIRREGIDALPWTPALRQWQARVQLMCAQPPGSNSGPGWPDLSDAALLAGLAHWLPPWLDGITRRAHFGRIDLPGALRSQLSHAQQVTLDRDMPSHFVVPSGSRIAIDYLDGETPSLSVRLQEVFGLAQSPAIAAGRVPLVLKLLSPAGRPVQITRDLTSFWKRGYHEVRKDLKGRYPKHYWPEDPHTAVPTRRARPR